MVRATPAQLAMFKRQLNGSQPPLHLPRGPKSKQQRAAQPENQVEGQLVGFLRAKGWIVTRRHVGKMVPLGLLLGALERGKITKDLLLRSIVDVGAKYAADWHAERYVTRLLKQTLELEVKGPKERPSDEQLNWIRERNMLGFPATWADSLEMFVEWYKSEGFDSGL